ncbi:MAG: nucleotidyltransferase [Firmicutes bacterium HGW-Firmicutes-1]|jgi:predicted nucleotidyltransferase|nr:MAG: nucleotidyltransferase [Firmicutes bacterium HGW-Firmicutes-1]
MNVVGLITEYNPFHKGHLYHVEEAKKITGSDYCIAVMSGNFVQRGDPAVVNKWVRAKSALDSGIDMVIEIPVHYATASAEFFSTASVALLHNTGIVNSICFGSEEGNLDTLDSIADLLANEPESYKVWLAHYLDKGFNYPTARSKALKKYFPHNFEDVINSPNNILGIEYLKALKRLNSKMSPFTIKRVGAGYHDESSSAPVVSATAIRKQLKANTEGSVVLESMLPTSSLVHLREAIDGNIAPIFPNDFFPLLKYKLLTTHPSELCKVLDITEGLENRILSAISQANSIEVLLDMVTTKRYTRTKINRALIHILLDIDKKPFQTFNHNGYSQYIKVLGFNKKAQHLMKQMKDYATLPIITNVKASSMSLTSLQKKMLDDEIRATNIYNTIVLSKFNQIVKNDYTQPVILT